MLSYIVNTLAAIEADKTVRTRGAVFARLRSLGLDDFGEVLMRMPNPSFRRISSLLPAMASDSTQDSWTGAHGYTLLQQTCAFVRVLAYNYARFTRRTLNGARILDYGCGWGRIARLLYYFSDEENVYGVDPWDRSIAECKKAGLGGRLRLSDYFPKTLPVDGLIFDCAIAFSVFTHLSERAASAALAAIRAVTVPGGILALTIRPPEYWDLAGSSAAEPARRVALKAEHVGAGFAFFPHPDRTPIDGDVTYGDASMSLAWLDQRAVGWKRVGIDRSIEDGFQLHVYLQAQ